MIGDERLLTVGESCDKCGKWVTFDGRFTTSDQAKGRLRLEAEARGWTHWEYAAQTHWQSADQVLAYCPDHRPLAHHTMRRLG